jgi:hypothetical protein
MWMLEMPPRKKSPPVGDVGSVTSWARISFSMKVAPPSVDS